jgi:hypothetical protein
MDKISRRENLEKIAEIDIFVSKINFNETYKGLNISWINPRITDFDYSFDGSFLGNWNVEVLRPKNKMKFEDIVNLCKQDGYEPANIFHLLSFVNSVGNIKEYKSLMAPKSISKDDFGYIGCVVLENTNELKLGLGNWRGSKIGGYDILRVKKA